MEIFAEITTSILHYVIAKPVDSFLELISLVSNLVLLVTASRLMLRALRNEVIRRRLQINSAVALLSYQQIYHGGFKLALVPLLLIPWEIGLRQGITHPLGATCVILIAVLAAILSIFDEMTSARLASQLDTYQLDLREKLEAIPLELRNDS